MLLWLKLNQLMQKSYIMCFLCRDICTVKETQAMAQRLQVASQLSAGRNYNAVCADTGASSATISRVNRCLLYGGGGYRIALERMKEGTQNAD